MKKLIQRSGVADMPFRLIVISVLIVLTLSVASVALKGFSDNQIEQDIRIELQKLERYIILCYQAGISTSFIVSLDFQRSLLSELTEMKIGDSITGDGDDLIKGDFSSSISYKISSSGIKLFPLSQSVIMTKITDHSDERISGEPLIFHGAKVKIQLTHIEYGNEIIIGLNLIQ